MKKRVLSFVFILGCFLIPTIGNDPSMILCNGGVVHESVSLNGGVVH